MRVLEDGYLRLTNAELLEGDAELDLAALGDNLFAVRYRRRLFVGCMHARPAAYDETWRTRLAEEGPVSLQDFVRAARRTPATHTVSVSRSRLAL